MVLICSLLLLLLVFIDSRFYDIKTVWLLKRMEKMNVTNPQYEKVNSMLTISSFSPAQVPIRGIDVELQCHQYMEQNQENLVQAAQKLLIPHLRQPRRLPSTFLKHLLIVRARPRLHRLEVSHSTFTLKLYHQKKMLL